MEFFFSKTKEQESLLPLPDIFAAVNSGFLDIPAETSTSRSGTQPSIATVCRREKKHYQ
jgi:hypothetical protein